MPLIKRENVREIIKDSSGKVSVVEHDEIDRQGLSDEEIEEIRQRIVSAANADGEKIKKDAMKLAESIKDKAYKDGLDAGRKEASKKMEGHLREALKVIDEARSEKQRIMNDTEEDILTISTKIATQLMNSELTIRPDIIMNVVKDAITKISDNKDIILRVAQEDLEEVRANKELIEELMDTRNLTITADRKIDQGGCMIETKLGFIDARVETKTEMILSALLHVYRDDKLKEEAGLIKKKTFEKDKNSGSKPEHPLADDEFNPSSKVMDSLEKADDADTGNPRINNIRDDLDL